MEVKTFNTIAKHLINDVGHCELCGSKRNLEVHHIIPKCTEITGIDLNNQDNLIVLCSSCHSKLTPKSMLIKYGIAKSRNNYLTKMKFYKSIEDISDEEYVLNAIDFLDIVDSIYNKMDNEG